MRSDARVRALPMGWMTRLYSFSLRLAQHPRAFVILAFLSFCESIFLPTPPDVLIIPMVLASPKKAWKIAFVATLMSVLGAIVGYMLGHLFYHAIGAKVIEFYGYQKQFATVTLWYRTYGNWIVFAGAFSPIPFKVVTILSGLFSVHLWSFVGISLLARGGRFFLVAGLLYRFGEPVKLFIERWLGQLALLFVVLLVGGFLVLKFV